MVKLIVHLKSGGNSMAEDDVKIVMFCCNWCSYGGADTAGTARMQYPPNVRVIRVMCSGRIEPQFVFKAFREGADGVIVAGCHHGDCHYDAGNYKLCLLYTSPSPRDRTR